jgi:predicted metalloenzyme YecM
MNEEGKELNELEFEQPLEEEIERIEIPLPKRKAYTSQGDPEIVVIEK